MIGSNSHLEYIARLKKQKETEGGRLPGFGDFVEIASEGILAVGVVFDTRIFNPEIAGAGQRIGSQPAFAANVGEAAGETGHLLGLLVIGFRQEESGAYEQQPPKFVLPHGSEVRLMAEERFREFHSADGSVRVTYTGKVLKHAGILGQPLMQAILRRLGDAFGKRQAPALSLIERSIAWRESGI